jgi:Fe-S-cluster containining protein
VRSVLTRVAFWLGDERFDEQVTLPAGTVQPGELLPAAYALTEAIVSRGVQRGGAVVSCRKGCGACCRQVVPVSQTEARHLRRVVEQMPEPRRSAVISRFAEARARLEASGLLERLRWPVSLGDPERQTLAVDYFHQQIACPFLEDESCSIYADRPLVCREYLVTTPAENCGVPTVEPVIRVQIAGRPSVAMGQLEETTAERGVWWMPLTLALDWAVAHPQNPPRRPARDLLRTFVEWLQRTS